MSSTDAPGIPTEVVATPGVTTIQLDWEAPASDGEVTNYRVRITPPTTAPRTTVVSSGTLTFTWTGLLAGVTYTVAVQAIGPGGNSAYESLSTTTLTGPPPGTPTGVAATPGMTTIKLDWVAPVSGGILTNYRVRLTPPSTAARTTVVSSDTLSYTWTDLIPGTTYAVAVQALGPGGASAYDGVSSTTPTSLPPDPPRDVRVYVNEEFTVVMAWRDPIDPGPVAHYQVRMDGGASTTLDVAQHGYAWPDLTPGSLHTFEIRSTGSGGNSSWVAHTLKVLPTEPRYAPLHLERNLLVEYFHQGVGVGIPDTWIGISASVQSMTTHHEPLAASTLSCLLISDHLDPSVNRVLEPGIWVRVRISDALIPPEVQFNGNNIRFMGIINQVEVDYQIDRQARITITATDAATWLANTIQPDGYWSLEDLPLLMERGVSKGQFFPWPFETPTIDDLELVIPVNVDGSDEPRGSGDGVIYYDESRSYLDQLAILRDGTGSFIWISKDGILNAWSPPYDAAGATFTDDLLTDPDDFDALPYSSIETEYSSEEVVNYLTITINQTDATTEESVSFDLGPFTDDDSIARWGIAEKTITVYNPDPDVTEAFYYDLASRILAVEPAVRPRSVTVPVTTLGVLTDVAWQELYLLAHVHQTDRVDGDYRILTIEDQISTRIIEGWPRVVWSCKFTFGDPDAVASVSRASSSSPLGGGGSSGGGGGGGGTPSSVAGGDLTGFFPNPEIRAGAVSTAELADSSVTSAKIVDGTVAAVDLAAGVIPSSLPPSGPAGGGAAGAWVAAVQALGSSVALWARLGELAGPTMNDASGAAHHGAYSGATLTYNQTGGIANDTDPSILFSGINPLGAVAYGAWMEATTGYSAGVWFKANALAATNVLIARDTQSSGRRFQLSIDSTGKLTFTQFDVASGTTAITTTTTYNDGAWHFACITNDPTLTLIQRMKLYVDAVPINGGSANLLATNLTPGFQVGNAARTTQSPANCWLDEVIFLPSVPLSAAQVTTLYNAGRLAAIGDLTGTYPNPVIAPNVITSAKIKDGTIQTVDLADSAVTTAKLGLGAVTNTQLAPNAVTSSNIQDGTIQAADLAPGVVPGIDDPGWVVPTLTNGWTFGLGSPFQSARYCRLNGVVYLEGTLTPGTNAAAAFTLPPGYRPLNLLMFQGATNSNAVGAGRVDIRSDGTVNPQLATTWQQITFSFRASQ